MSDIESLMRYKEEKLVLKPAELEDNDNPYYEMLDDNPHTRNVYYSYSISDMMMIIGMDRIISFWKINQ